MTLSSALMVAAIFNRFTGYSINVALLIEAEFLFILGLRLEAQVFARAWRRGVCGGGRESFSKRFFRRREVLSPGTLLAHGLRPRF